MTTYILHGGETSRDDPENEQFFACFTKYVEKNEVKILMCYFTKEKEIWEKRLESDRKKIAKHTTKKVTLSLANDPEDLLEKLNTHDVLYVAGGNAQPLESYLPLFGSFKEKLKDKVYLGCSMGAFIVSSQYVLTFDDQENSTVHKGLGLLPFSTLCHWNIEKKKEEKVGLLKEAAPNSPILLLEECKFTTIIR